MIDVAKAAGVSRTTVSFVLNGREANISIETQRRVLDAAEQMGFRANASALALVTGRTRRIGIVTNKPEYFRDSNPYFGNVFAGITSAALRHDYNLLLHSAHYPDWQAIYADILSGPADGTILIGRGNEDALTLALLEAGFPTVCVSYHVEHPDCCTIDCDNELGGYLALRHLIGLGHRQIAFFYPGESTSWGHERRLGALRALAEARLSEAHLQIRACFDSDNEHDAWVRSAIAYLQNADPRPTALVCCEEEFVQRLVEALPGVGIHVPDDLAVISFNSTVLSARTHPPMTSVAQPLQEIGAAALDMLVGRIGGQEISARCLRFPMSLNVRQSCGAAQNKPDA
jgi:DNA-binding LacI/PurR family transcriptional regulator